MPSVVSVQYFDLLAMQCGEARQAVRQSPSDAVDPIMYLYAKTLPELPSGYRWETNGEFRMRLVMQAATRIMAVA